MTLQEARAFVVRSGGQYTVYRMPTWPDGVWSATMKPPKELPDNAVIDDPPKREEPQQLGGLFS